MGATENPFRRARLRRGVHRQVDAARSVGRTQPTISAWEQGRRKPALDDLCKLADLYGCTLDRLVGRDIELTLACDNCGHLMTSQPLTQPRKETPMTESDNAATIAEALLRIGESLARIEESLARIEGSLLSEGTEK